jgi:hypothetical protein
MHNLACGGLALGSREARGPLRRGSVAGLKSFQKGLMLSFISAVLRLQKSLV